MIKYITCSVVFLWCLQAYSATIWVSNTQDSGTGSLRAAVALAQDTDTIRFNPNLLSSGNDTINLQSGISISKPLVIKGLYNATDTLFISGQNTTLIFGVSFPTSSNRSLVLDSMALVKGYSVIHGAAITFFGEYLEISNSYICHNTSWYYGGAIHCSSYQIGAFKSHHLIIKNSNISHNTAMQNMGGAICAIATENSIVDISDSKINDNRASFSVGGGLASFSESRFTQVSITGCEISRNFAYDEGGGVYAASYSKSFSPATKDSIKLLVSNSILDGNTSNLSGGGIYSYLYSYYDHCTYTVLIDHSRISNNSSLQHGGGVYSYSDNHIYDQNSSSFTVSNSEISNNMASLSGGGIYSFAPSSLPSASNMVLSNSTFSYNEAGVNGGGIFSTGYYGRMDMDKCSVFNNSSNGKGGGIYFFTVYSSIVFQRSLSLNHSTVSENTATTSGGGIYTEVNSAGYTLANLKNSTIYRNFAPSGAGIYTQAASLIGPSSLITTSSILAHNQTSNIVTSNLLSNGYNLFSDAVVSGSVATDLVGIDSANLNLGPLQNNGGLTFTRMPMLPSVTTDAGNPSDLSAAQNWSLTGIRDIGAAEAADLQFDTLNATACDSLISPSGNYIWYLSGTYYDTIIGTPNQLFTVHLAIQKSFSSLNVHQCDANYTAPSGAIYTQSGTYSDTIINSAGCDSILTINLSIGFSSSNTIIATACNSYLSPAGNTYTTNGTYTETIPNAAGCDSIITINLTLLQSSASLVENVCADFYTSPSGKIFTTSGTYQDTITNSFGCDSILTIQVNLNQRFASRYDTICNSFFVSPSGKIWTQSGTYADTIQNSLACDSIITIYLTAYSFTASSSQNGSTLQADQNGLYQWLNCDNNYAPIPTENAQAFLATVTGNYAVEITSGACIDTSACILVDLTAIDELQEQQFHVSPNPFENGFNIELPTVYAAIELKILDLHGKILLENNFSNTHFIELHPSLEAGSYFLMVQLGADHWVQKIIQL